MHGTLANVCCMPVVLMRPLCKELPNGMLTAHGQSAVQQLLLHRPSVCCTFR